MASPEQFFGSGYPPRPLDLTPRGSIDPAAVGAMGRWIAENGPAIHAAGSARLSGGGTLRAEGIVTRGKPDRRRLMRNAAALAFAGLYLAVPPETVDRAAGWATIAAFLLYLYDRSK